MSLANIINSVMGEVLILLLIIETNKGGPQIEPCGHHVE